MQCRGNIEEKNQNEGYDFERSLRNFAPTSSHPIDLSA